MNSAIVLIVDDEIPFIQALSKRLKKREFSITEAFSGSDALRILNERQDIEVVLLDVKMPGIDGIETLQTIKQKYPLVEVIMLTGHGTIETAIEGMKLGAFDYLLKPCEIEILVSKVNEASARKRMHEKKIIEARINRITKKRV
ncbi:MAG: response regulator [Desulfobacterales bacterium]|nr:response regulator [Desulfobacterales bacterium]